MPAPPITNPTPQTCANCGAGLTSRTELCPHCGAQSEGSDESNAKIALPLVGMILFGILCLALLSGIYGAFIMRAG